MSAAGDFYLNLALSILFQSIKDPQKRATYTQALTRLRDELNVVLAPVEVQDFSDQPKGEPQQ